MKRYEFHSSLAPELIFARLSMRAKADRSLDPWTAREAFLYSRKNDRFYLSYTGKYPLYGFFPFRGRVSTEEGGSLIAGRFPLIRLAVFAATAVFFLALLSGGPPGFAAKGTVIAFLWFMLAEGLMQRLVFRSRREAVLRFIEENLLA